MVGTPVRSGSVGAPVRLAVVALGALGLGTVTTPSYPLHVNSTGQSAFIAATAAADDVHALTVSQGTVNPAHVNAVAANFVSAAPNSSTVYMSGSNLTRSILKISHAGQADGSDSSGSCIGLDPNPSVAGSSANGLAVIPTLVTAGNLVMVRGRAGLEDFTVKGATGHIAAGLPTAATPRGVVEIGQQGADVMPALFLQANSASSQQLILCRDSGGNARFEVSATGGTVHRATAFFTGAIQVGSASSDFGAGTGSMLSMKNATAVPSTNPTAGGIIYIEAGALKYRGSSGTVTVVAPA